MNKIILLVVNYFNNYIGTFNKSKNKTKYGIGGSFLLIFGAIFVFLFTTMAISTVQNALSYVNDTSLNLTPEEVTEYLQMPLYVTVGMMVMFLLLLTVTKVTQSKRNNDDELLLALPFKKSHIVISKIIFNYVFDLGMVLSTILPSFIVYYVLIPTKPDILYFARFSYLILLIPMLSNAIGTLLGALFNVLTKRFVKANAIRSLISVGFMVLFLLGYYALQFNLELSAGSGFSMSDITPLKALVDYLLCYNNWFLTFIIVSAICIVPFIICVIVSALSLGKHVSTANKKNKKIVYKKTSITKTMLEQEIGKYLNSNTYVLNTLFGGVILVILSIMYLVVGEGFLTSKFLVLSNNNDIVQTLVSNIPLIVIALATVVISTMAISNNSISFEGKNIWIIKANPISYKKVFLSKALCNFIICLICIIVSTVFFGSRFIIDHQLNGIIYVGAYFIITTIFALLISFSGIFVNLIFPKLEWQTEAEVIKQSLASGIGLLVNMVLASLCLIPILVSIIAFSEFIILVPIAISVVILILLLVVVLILLNTIGKKLYAKI